MRRLLAALAAAGVLGAGLLASPAPRPADAAVPITKVLTIVEENRTRDQAWRGMPYLVSLARTYGFAGSYRAITYPSLPNYLAMAGGATFGVADSGPPSEHPISGWTVFDQAIAMKRTAKLYAESMPRNCYRADHGLYVTRHNPWGYFADPARNYNCWRFDVPAGTTSAGALRSDIAAGRLPHVGMLVPNNCNNGHDCSLATADGWLRRWLPVIMAGPDYRAGRLAIVVTFDEDDRSQDNTVLTVVIAPGVRGVRSMLGFNHYSWTRWMNELVGAPLLRNAAGARSLRTGFGL